MNYQQILSITISVLAILLGVYNLIIAIKNHKRNSEIQRHNDKIQIDNLLDKAYDFLFGKNGYYKTKEIDKYNEAESQILRAKRSMKKKLTMIICSLFISCGIQAQIFQPTTESLQKHDLSWIKSKNAFDQSKLLASQIENEIKQLIQKYNYENSAIGTIDIPINTKKLDYLGFKHPNELGIFTANPISNTNSTSINKQLHIYRYENFYFSTEDDNETSQKNVYFSIRAIEILRTLYNDAFDKLFVQTLSYTGDRPKFEKWSNSNRFYWTAFNTTPDYIAKSYTSFLGAGYFPNIDGISDIGRYKNVVVIDVHSGNILGNDATKGSKPIYKKPTPEENYLLYMKEGLVETYIHEMLHRYIDYLYTDDKTISDIRKSRDLANFNAAEENAILNTSLSYFIRKGGISDELIKYYYSEVFNYNIKSLKDNNQYNTYIKIFADLPTISTGKDRLIFKLKVLDY